MKDGEPCTSRGVSTVLEGVTPRPRTKGSMAWRFLPYELYTIQRYLQYRTLQEHDLQHFDAWASMFGETVTAVELTPDGEEQESYILGLNYLFKSFKRKVIVIVHRNDDIEEKWIVTPENISFTKEEIMRQIKFQEKYFDSYIIM